MELEVNCNVDRWTCLTGMYERNIVMEGLKPELKEIQGHLVVITITPLCPWICHCMLKEIQGHLHAHSKVSCRNGCFFWDTSWCKDSEKKRVHGPYNLHESLIKGLI